MARMDRLTPCNPRVGVSLGPILRAHEELSHRQLQLDSDNQRASLLTGHPSSSQQVIQLKPHPIDVKLPKS